MPEAVSASSWDLLYFSVIVYLDIGDEAEMNKARQTAWPQTDSVLPAMPVHPWSKGSRYRLSGLQIAGRHLARLHVALEFEADLLTFDELAHPCALNSRDVYEGVSAAVVRLDKAETLGGIEPFYCASGHDEPFQSIE